MHIVSHNIEGFCVETHLICFFFFFNFFTVLQSAINRIAINPIVQDNARSYVAHHTQFITEYNFF